MIVDPDPLRVGLEREWQRGIDDQTRFECARLGAEVPHLHEDQVVPRRSAGTGEVHPGQRRTIQRAREKGGGVDFSLGGKDPKAIEDCVFVGGLGGGVDRDIDAAVGIRIVRIEPVGTRLVLADVCHGVHRPVGGPFDPQNLHALSGFAPPTLAQGQGKPRSLTDRYHEGAEASARELAKQRMSPVHLRWVLAMTTSNRPG